MRDIRKIIDLLIKQQLSPNVIIDNVSDLASDDFHILTIDECQEYATKSTVSFSWIALNFGNWTK